MQVGGAGAGGRGRCRWSGPVQVVGVVAGGRGRCRWARLVQVDRAGTGGRGWCRWAGAGGLVQVGRLTRVCADVVDMRGC